MGRKETLVIGDFIESDETCQFDLSSTLRLRARSIDRKKLWASKDRSAEFMGDIWSLFVDSKNEKRIGTVLHSICVEMTENAVKYGCKDHDYMIIIELCLKNDVLLVYVINKCAHDRIAALEASAHQVLNAPDARELFKQKMREAKVAKKMGENRSQLGFTRIVMQGVQLAWQIKMDSDLAVVSTLAKIELI